MIEQMTTRYPQMEWLEIDVRDLKFADDSFDIVIDKGELDSWMNCAHDRDHGVRL